MMKCKKSLSKEDLKNDLLYDTLKALSKALKEIEVPLYVVGATARDIIMILLDEGEMMRRTFDLDIAIALKNWEEFDKVRIKLEQNHFKKDKSKQRFFYKGENNKNDFEVDVVPFGKISEDEQICWPPEGNPVMSVRCFEDIMAHSLEVSIDDITFRIASLCGQFLIKLDAWIDRHSWTDKDAVDMYYFIRHYYVAMVMNNNIPPDEIDLEEDMNEFDFSLSSPRWLAYDISKILSTKHLKYYIQFLQEELKKGENSELLYHFMKNYDVDKDGVYEWSFKVWNETLNFLIREFETRNHED